MPSPTKQQTVSEFMFICLKHGPQHGDLSFVFALVMHTSLKWTSCMPTSSIIAASSSMFGVTTRNAVQPCLIMPAHGTNTRQSFLVVITNVVLNLSQMMIILVTCVNRAAVWHVRQNRLIKYLFSAGILPQVLQRARNTWPPVNNKNSSC